MTDKSNSQKTSWKVWWKLTRPHTLTAGFVPVLIGTAFAFQSGDFHITLFFAMMIASLLIQAATNMFNEYYDYKRGLDHAGSVGIGGTIVRHGVKASTVLQIALGCYGLALLIGLYICAMTSWWLIAIGLLSMAAGYLYTGGPYPVAYTPYGELLAGFFMGYVIIAISYYIQTNELPLTVLFISVPTSLFIANILSANNIRDLDNDKVAGRRTLAILLGKRNAIMVLAIIFGIAFVWTLTMPFLGITSFWIWIALLAFPKSIEAVKVFINKHTPIEMMPGMAATAKTNTIFGLLFALGIFLGSV